jgi:hypothetical protein
MTAEMDDRRALLGRMNDGEPEVGAINFNGVITSQFAGDVLVHSETEVLQFCTKDSGCFWVHE